MMIKHHPYHNETVWIIGASSGIGEALAKELAASGARLILSGRRAAELETLCQTLHEISASLDIGSGNLKERAIKDNSSTQRFSSPSLHTSLVLDVADSDAITQAVDSMVSEDSFPDRVIFMAAIFRPNDISAEDIGFIKNLIAVNLTSAIILSHAVLAEFEKRVHLSSKNVATKHSRNQLAICASLAGYVGFPGKQPYNASKAALMNFTESLYGQVSKGIDIKLITPGFVRTRITNNNSFPMPCLMDADKAARIIARGLNKNSFEIHFPKRLTWFMKIIRLLPYSLLLRLTRSTRDQVK